MGAKKLQLATIGGGCFWCTEAVFQDVIGVEKVVSGYSGGTVPGHPTYREICSGLTGHAEVVQITFDAHQIAFETILQIFMTMHDPTTLNKQGADSGTQYRSVIYYHNDMQKVKTKIVLKDMAPHFEAPIVTEISPFSVFYEAEKTHQNYFVNNPSEPYCSVVIAPKLIKLRVLYAEKLKLK